MIDNTLALNAYSSAKLDPAMLRNSQNFGIPKDGIPSSEFKAGFKAKKELENGIDTKALREQTDAFESFFVKMVLDISLKNENPLFGKDAGDEIYHSMYNDTMSRALGGGFGFSDLLYNFLLERAK